MKLDSEVMTLKAKSEEDDHTIDVTKSKVQHLTSQLMMRGIEV